MIYIKVAADNKYFQALFPGSLLYVKEVKASRYRKIPPNDFGQKRLNSITKGNEDFSL